MNAKLTSLFAVMGLGLMIASAGAGTTASITVTVTVPSVISVSVNTGTWAAGNLALGGTTETSSQFTATNDGNVSEDFAVQCGYSANWTCGAAAGNEVFAMNAKGEALTNWTGIGTSQTLQTNVAKDASASFDLQLTAPTATVNVDAEQTMTVMLTASKH